LFSLGNKNVLRVEQNKNKEQSKNREHLTNIKECGKMVSALHNMLSFVAVTGFVFLMCHVMSLAA